MDELEITKLCMRPGVEGMLWRLIRKVDPDEVTAWVRREKTVGLKPEDAIQCLADLMSGMSMVLALELRGLDRRDFLLGQRGLLKTYERMLRARLEQVGGIHRVSTIDQLAQDAIKQNKDPV